MKILLLTLAVIAVTQAAIIEPRRRPVPVPMRWVPVQAGDRIVGGNDVLISDAQYQISLQYQSRKVWYHICGGSIIKSRWVVTAAHCVDGTPAKKLQVGYGLTSANGYKTSNRIALQSIKQHSGYNSNTLVNDIALLELKTAIPFGSESNTIPCAASGHDISAGSTIKISGWGTTSEGGSLSDHLKMVSVPAISNSECDSMLNPGDLYEKEMFCAGLKQGGADSCQGDSGGPAVQGNVPVLVGIVSWGYGCARAGNPGVYTRVSNYDQWIQSYVQ